MSEFWIKWLKGWSLFLAAFGALFAVVDLGALGAPARLFIDFAFLKLFSGQAVAMDRVAFATTGLLGAVTLGWGLFMYLIIPSAAKADAGALRSALGISMTVWYLFDQAASWRAGAYGNMISNTALLAVFLLPLLADRFAPATPSAASRSNT